MSLTWTLVTVSLAQLHPWEGNPKTTTRKQAEQLVTSHDDLGQFQTVAISPFDAAGLALVYDGHQRLSAWQQAYGPDFTIQALQASRPLTAQEQRKIAIYSRQIGAWDWDILSSWEPTELTAWGFDVDLLSDWRRDVAALGDFLESEEEQATADAKAARQTLAERFIVPPFSVLDARQGYWQNRKAAWLALGIQSELGRGENALDMSATMVGITDPEERAAWNTRRRESPWHTLGAIAPNQATGVSPDYRKRVKMAMHDDPMQRKDRYDGKE